MHRRYTAGCFVVVTFTGLLFAGDEGPASRPLHEQSRDGVTVRLEKIAVQRVLHESDSENQGTPERSVSVFVSISGAGNSHGPDKIEFANGQKPTSVSAIGKSPPNWPAHVDWQDNVRRQVDPKAIGFERRYGIPDGVKVDDLFPAAFTVTTTTKSGQKLEFRFKNLRF